MLVIGKTIGGGIPVGRLRVHARRSRSGSRGSIAVEDSDVGGIGGTLAGYALSLAATRATLGEVLTAAAFERMIPLAERWEAGVERGPSPRRGVPVARDPPRAPAPNTTSCPTRRGPAPSNGRTRDPELERFLHLWAMNRGVLMTPFHNMALMSPATTEADVDRHTEVFAEAVEALFA